MLTFNHFTRLFTFLLLIVVTLMLFPVSATVFTEDGSELTESELYEITNNTTPSDEKSPVIFLYDPECGACAPAHEYLETYLKENPDVKIEMMNLSDGNEGKKKYDEMKAAFHREKVYIPVMYIGSLALEDAPDIMTHFVSVYKWYTQ